MQPSFGRSEPRALSLPRRKSIMLKLNVGFSKKLGEPNYGSRGAAVNLELELEPECLGDAERLKDRIRQLFLQAKASVHEELAASGEFRQGEAGLAVRANGRPRERTRSATAAQIRALGAIADRWQIDLGEW